MNKQEKERYDVLIEEYKDGQSAYSLREKMLKESALIEMRADLMNKFEQTTFKQDDERSEIWRKMQVIAWFDNKLTQIIENGKLAENELSTFDKFKRFFKGN